MASIDRREALAGLTIAAAIGSTTSPALPRSANRREWNAAMAAYLEADRKSSALRPRLDKINEAYQEGRKALPEVASDWEVRRARNAWSGVGYLEDVGDNYERYRAYHALVKADDERKAKLEALDKRLGWTAINDRYDALTEAMSQAETALLSVPAPDGEALMWKVERLYTPGEGIWGEGYEDQTHADLRRFLLSGRA